MKKSNQVLRILIGSAGRQRYLGQWFDQAFEELGLRGEVHFTEHNPHCATYSSTPHHHLLPLHHEDGYETELLRLCRALEPALFFSVSDFELTHMAARNLGEKLRSLGIVVLGLGSEQLPEVQDKYRMFKALRAQGIAAVPTALLSQQDEVARICRSSQHLIVKDRFGHGSSGLMRIASQNWEVESAIALSRAARLGQGNGYGAPASLVVQPEIVGTEFGLDIVAPIIADRHGLGVLVRKKLAMRAGETDQAVTVAATEFLHLSSQIHGWLQHQGLIDVDVMVSTEGTQYVLDVNPRFGGGYPFNYLAGANVPALFLAQLAGARGSDLDQYLEYEPGVFSSKFEGVTRELGLSI